MRTEPLIFLIKWAIVTVSTKQKPPRPRWSSAHLLAEGFHGHLRIRLDYEFIVDVHHDVATALPLHGKRENIAAGGLDYVFHEFWTVGFKPLPLLHAAYALIGYAA